MSAASIIRRLFGMRPEIDGLPSIEEGEAAARASDMPWLSKAAFEDFGKHPEVQGGFGEERASVKLRRTQRIYVGHH